MLVIWMISSSGVKIGLPGTKAVHERDNFSKVTFQQELVHRK